MHVRDVMETEVHTVHPDTLAIEAARQMRERDVGLLPITEGERLVGVLTDRDITVRCLAEGRDPHSTPVEEIMSMEIVCCFEDETVEQAKALMTEQGVRRLPVIDRQERLVGIISSSTLPSGGLSDLSREASPKKPKEVRFVKEKTDAYGRPHKVPLRTIYITGARSKEEAAEKAVKKFEEEHGTPWSNVANTYEVHEEAPQDRKDP